MCESHYYYMYKWEDTYIQSKKSGGQSSQGSTFGSDQTLMAGAPDQHTTTDQAHALVEAQIGPFLW